MAKDSAGVTVPLSNPLSEAVSEAVGELLEPLAQLAMEMQIGASDFIRLIEQAFIRAVEQDAMLAGRPLPGASAVAARSGLTRQRVSQLRSKGSAAKPPGAERQPQTLRILVAWKTDPKFIDHSGYPKILPIRGPVSFTALVRGHGSGLRARSILKELERIKAVRLTKDGAVEMLNRANLDAAQNVQRIRDLGEFGREFLETLIYNVLNPETPRYHRRVVGLHIDPAEVPRLVRDAASQAGVWALALQDAVTDNSVTVKADRLAHRATRVSGHFFICERPSLVRAVSKATTKSPRPGEATTPTFSLGEHIETGSNRGQDLTPIWKCAFDSTASPTLVTYSNRLSSFHVPLATRTRR